MLLRKEEGGRIKEKLGTFVMLSVYSDPDKNLLEESSNTLCVVRYRGSEGLHVIEAKTITSVVAVILFVLSEDEKQDPGICAQYSQCFFVGEKPFLDFTTDTMDPLLQVVEASTSPE